jgi:hypothetical protein
MSIQLITLDKFGSETSPVKEKVYRQRRCFILVCLPQPGSNRITERSRQMTAPAESASEALGKSDGSTHVPLRSDGC